MKPTTEVAMTTKKSETSSLPNPTPMENRIERFFNEVTAISYPATHPLLKEACDIINELTAELDMLLREARPQMTLRRWLYERSSQAEYYLREYDEEEEKKRAALNQPTAEKTHD